MAIVDFQIFYIIGEASPDGPPGATLECNSTVFYRSSIVDIYMGQRQFDWFNDGIPYGIMLEVIPYVTRDGSAEFNNPITTSTAPSKTTDTTADFNSNVTSSLYAKVGQLTGFGATLNATFKLIDGSQAFLDGLGATLNATANVTRDFEVDLFVNTYVNSVFVNLVSSLDMFARGDKNVVEFESNPNVTSSLYAKVGKLTGFGGASVPITPSVVTSTIRTRVHLDAIPSYPATIDLAELGLSIPEGTNVTFNIGRGFVRDKTPNQQPIPAFPSWLSFRTAKEGIVPIAAEFDVTSSVGGIYPIALDNIASNFSLLAEPYRVRPFISLQVLQSNVTTFANITTDVFAVIPVTTTIVSDVNITTDTEATFVSSLQISPIENWRYRLVTSDITVNSQVITDAERFPGLIEDLLFESTVNSAANITADAFSDLTISSIVSSNVKVITDVTIDISVNCGFFAGADTLIIQDPIDLPVSTNVAVTDYTFLEWDTLNTASTEAEFAIYGVQSPVTIDWGDGSMSVLNTDTNIAHTYSTSDIFEISIDGRFNEFTMSYGSVSQTNRSGLTKIKAWGDHGTTSLANSCAYTSNLNYVDPYLSNSVTTLKGMFKNTFYNGAEISNLTTSKVTDMTEMLSQAFDFNQPIGNWDTSSVTDMTEMFRLSEKFNQPLDNWDTSSVTSMFGIFRYSTKFNGSIGNWDTSSVTNMSSMFSEAFDFNQPIGNWDTSSVTSMSSMFSLAFDFDQPLNNWDTSSVTNMFGMFRSTSVNQPLDTWDTSSVTSMRNMFDNAFNFNQPLNNWDTSSVIDMFGMFQSARTFNQPLNNWDTSSVTTMGRMFFGATNFNSNVGTWDTSNVTSMSGMFHGATNFNQPLNDWNTSQVTSMNSMFKSATNFNQPLYWWNTSKVTDMDEMFYKELAINPSNIGCRNWCVELIPSRPDNFGIIPSEAPYWGVAC